MTPAAELPADEGRGIPGAKEQPQRGPVADGETGDLDTNTTNAGDKAAIGPEKATDDEQYPPLSTVAPIMVALYLSMFLVALDRIIISTAIPKITDEFKSIDDIGWYASAYVLTGCATQLLFGRLYLFYNNKNVFLAAVLLFEAGSALCGAAPTSIAFILGRAIAGCGAAGVFSGVIVIMIPLTPLRKRPMWQGFLGAIFGVSSVIGPLIGGAFTKNESLTWRWCFYINLPIGAVPIIIVIFFLHLSAPHYADLDFKGKLARMDVIGNLLFLPCIISLLLALQWGGSEYSWNNGRIIALLVLFVVLLVAWVGVQIRVKKNATVPPHIITQRSIIAGFCFSACIGGVMLSMGYYLPIWFQAIDGVDALQSGIRGIPFVLALVVSSIIAGGFVAAVGYYTPMVILCSVLMTVGAGLLTTLHVGSGSAEWIGYQFLAGFGMGFGMQQSGMAAQVVLADVDVPVGASLMIFAQQLGGAVFVCAAQNVFLQQLVANLGTVIPREAAGLLSHVGATDLRNLVPAELLPAVLVQYNKTIMTTFYVGVAVSAISIVPALLFEWRSVKGTGKGPHDGEAMETGTKAVVARKH